MGIFSKIKEKLFGKKQNEKYVAGLDKSRQTFKGKLKALFARFKKVDEEYYQELEDLLISSDVGARLSYEIVDATKEEAKYQGITDPDKILELLVEEMYVSYKQDIDLDETIHYAEEGPTIIMMVGVNGVGKTTTIAKLTHRFQKEGKKVLLVAADTFRAGAVEQLGVWADRLNVDIVKGKENADPSSVIFDGMRKAKDSDYDIVIVDTAGRLQTKVNLMNEIAKMCKVIKKEFIDGPHETFLVIDATTGQNGVFQAKVFAEVTGVSGIVLTKMDGTSKGGIVLAIKDQLQIPVRYIGLGEGVDDLMEFDLEAYLNGLVGITVEEE